MYSQNALNGHRSAVWGSYPMTLAEIYRPDVNLAILERELAEDVTAYAEFVARLSSEVHFAAVLGLDMMKSILRDYLPRHELREAFIQEVENMASVLGLLFDTEQMGVRLQSSETPTCPRFHIDRIPCRLLVSYLGRGTQWLEENNLDRRFLGSGGDERRVCLDEARINEVGRGHVMLFKGEGWEGNEGHGLVHRSPPLTDNSRRLLLTIDLA